jgi:hypothetical protein
LRVEGWQVIEDWNECRVIRKVWSLEKMAVTDQANQDRGSIGKKE